MAQVDRNYFLCDMGEQMVSLSTSQSLLVTCYFGRSLGVGFWVEFYIYATHGPFPVHESACRHQQETRNCCSEACECCLDTNTKIHWTIVLVLCSLPMQFAQLYASGELMTFAHLKRLIGLNKTPKKLTSVSQLAKIEQQHSVIDIYLWLRLACCPLPPPLPLSAM